MEQKSIGKMIASLRRSNGMTQKEFGEKLFVSDKTVSRWERDECTPDLYLIPVIADIFGVTTDELLRGERIPAPPVSQFSTEKTLPINYGEKQIKRLLKLRLTKYKNQNWISIGVAVLGVFAALLCNFVFHWGLLGAWIGLGLVMAAAVCEICFTNNVFYRNNDEDADAAQEVFKEFNRSVVAVCKRTTQVILLTVALLLPLLFLLHNHVGLQWTSWLLTAAICLAIIFLTGFTVYRIWIEKLLCKYDLLQISDEDKQIRRNRKKVLKITGFPCGGVFIALLIVYFICMGCLTDYNFATPKKFDNYEDFKAYMAQDVIYGEWTDENGNAQIDTNEEVLFPDETESEKENENKNEKTYFLFNKNGEEVCQYVWRNQAVRYVHSAPTENGLPVKVYTKAEIGKANQRRETISFCLESALVVDCIVFIVLYTVFIRKEKTL